MGGALGVPRDATGFLQLRRAGFAPAGLGHRVVCEVSDSHLQAPTVSIIIPTYNRRHMLKEAVQSCLDQTFTDCEVLIVDDGSTDGTSDMVASWDKVSSSRGRVRYVLQENGGASSARNHGLRIAAGKYIQFLDSDDLLGSSKIARQLGVLRRTEYSSASCCLCFGRMIDSAKTQGGDAGVKIGILANSPSELVRGLCARRVHGMPTEAPLWRREFLMGRPGWREDISLGDDLEYYVRLLVDSREICILDEELFTVREHGGNRLSAGHATLSSVSSQVQARRSVHESAVRAGLWDVQTQGAFLDAMRTIYANTLETGDEALIGDLEGWLWELALAPRRRPQVQAMIGVRRLLGRQFLLGAHRMLMRLREI